MTEHAVALEESDTFANSALAAGFGVLVGVLLLIVGTAVALNWRGWAVRYTDLVDALVPATRRNLAEDRWPRMLIQTRITFGLTAAFGAVLVYGGIVALVRR
jgi:hypothetical protein